MTAVEADGLTKTFDLTIAVEDLSLTVSPGEVVGLLGANGAGKTTAMRMLLGLITPSSGVARIRGQPASEVDRRVIGYVPQGLGLYRDLTVLENLEFAASAFRVAVPALDRIGLAEIGGRRVGQISLGLRRQVAFAVAQCHHPSVLVLDEPTSGVGPLGRARLWEMIRETASSGAAILVSTHHMEEAAECDRVILMAEGRRMAEGSVADVIGGLRTVAISDGVGESALDAIRRRGGTVLIDGRGWRVVDLDAATIAELVGDDATVSEVPATFEEAFVVLSS
jgi:ABC-2 type transport system ATP-binding protein/ribosome-dependent ATPase